MRRRQTRRRTSVIRRLSPVACRLSSVVCRLSVGGPSPQGDVGVVALAVARGEACAWLRGDARGSGNGGGAGVRFVALFKRRAHCVAVSVLCGTVASRDTPMLIGFSGVGSASWRVCGDVRICNENPAILAVCLRVGRVLSRPLAIRGGVSAGHRGCDTPGSQKAPSAIRCIKTYQIHYAGVHWTTSSEST